MKIDRALKIERVCNDTLFGCISMVDKNTLQFRYSSAVKYAEASKNSKEPRYQLGYKISMIEIRYIRRYYPEFCV